MAIYRFKVSYEDNEDIFREIEIKSTQTFEDFHHTIVQSFNFDNQHNASFFISDDYWRKGEEILLHEKDSSTVAGSKRQEAEVVKKIMSKCKMASLIDDPHQKFVYVYDPKTGWTFLVELLKIVADDAKATYPRIVKNVGEAPKQYKSNTVAATVSDEELDELPDEEEAESDNAAYSNAHNEEDTALLDGEEGEEETTEGDDDLMNNEEEEADAEFDDHAEDKYEED